MIGRTWMKAQDGGNLIKSRVTTGKRGSSDRAKSKMQPFEHVLPGTPPIAARLVPYNRTPESGYVNYRR